MAHCEAAARVTSIVLILVTALVVGALVVSWQVLERSLSGPVQSAERLRCEYNPAAPVLDALSVHERVSYEQCDLVGCFGIEVSLRDTARRYHDPSSVKDC